MTKDRGGGVKDLFNGVLLANSDLYMPLQSIMTLADVPIYPVCVCFTVSYTSTIE